MTGGEEEQKKGESKGFAGLSSLVSDVDTTPPPAAKKEPAATAPRAERSASPPAQPQPQPSQRQTYQAPAQPSSGSSGGKWLLGIAAVIGVLLWLSSQSDKTATTSPAPAYSPPAQSTAPSYSPPSQPQVPSRPAESQPPVGQNLVFSREQIRYCLAEDIRLEGAKAAINNYVESDVDRFNAMVADYNSRCGSFRYRSGALESARQEIEQYRSQLQSEGRSRFARSSPDLLSKPSVAVVPPVSTPPVHAPSRQESTSPTNGGIPQNAHLNYLGNDWECNRGYYRAGNECQPVQMPRHATLDVYGSGWVCQRGYYKSGNECHPVQMPPNATLDVYGSGWVCQRGYYKSSNQCLPVQLPQNATLDVYGSGWVCVRGYARVGDNCV